MQITQDGSITIPLDIQEELGFLPGTEVELKIMGNKLQLQKKNSPTREETLINLMRGKATTHLTTDEIMEITRSTCD